MPPLRAPLRDLGGPTVTLPDGLSSSDFAPPLKEFFGAEGGLSPASIVRLTEQWQEEREAFMERDLSEKDYVYVWADGIHTER